MHHTPYTTPQTTEMAVSDLPGNPSAVWTVRGNEVRAPRAFAWA